MSAKHDGGSAFPLRIDNSDGSSEYHLGLSVRDYFATKAPISLKDVKTIFELGDFDVTLQCHTAEFFTLHTKLCYEYADAMLAERSKK